MFGLQTLFARSRVERTSLLDPDEFDATLARERSRADRVGSCFSLLTLSVPGGRLQPADMNAISEILRQRRRATDSTGQTRDGQIGIVLPDTSHAQAEVVAAFLSDTLGAKGISHTHTVQVYSGMER